MATVTSVEPRERTFPLAARGGTMAGLEFGPADRPLDVIFSHANGYNARTYRSILAPLGETLRILAIDLRGHGATRLPTPTEGRRDWTDISGDLLALIATLRGSTTVLFSTHVLADVERVCDRVAILNLGRLVVEAPLPELLERYAQPVYRLEAEPGQAVALATLARRLRGLPWVSGVSEDGDTLRVLVSDRRAAASQLLPAAVEAGLALAAFERQRPDLEEVFLRIVAASRPESPT